MPGSSLLRARSFGFAQDDSARGATVAISATVRRRANYAVATGAVLGACAPSASYLAKRWPQGESLRHCS